MTLYMCSVRPAKNSFKESQKVLVLRISAWVCLFRSYLGKLPRSLEAHRALSPYLYTFTVIKKEAAG